jgi:hypothetical protein
MSSAPSRGELPRLLGASSSRPLTVRLARTNEDLTRHGDESPAVAAAHRAAGKRRRCRDLVAAVAAMVGRPCSPSSRAQPLRVADRTSRTPTPRRSSPAATRNRFSSRLTAFLMHGVPSLAAPWRTAGSCGSGKHGDAPPSIAGSRSLGGERLTPRDVAPGALLVRVLVRFKRRDEKYVPAPASGMATRPDTRRGPVPHAANARGLPKSSSVALPTNRDICARDLRDFSHTDTWRATAARARE